VPPSFSNFDAAHAVTISKQENTSQSLISNVLSSNDSTNSIQPMYFHFPQLPFNLPYYPYSQSFPPNYQQFITSPNEIPTVYEFLKTLDDKFNTPGTYTQFEKTFIDEEITVNIIKDLSDIQLEKLGVTKSGWQKNIKQYASIFQ